jgi:hypothetical protein
LGLLWISLAVILALLAASWAGWRGLKEGGGDQTTGWPITLLAASLIMTLIAVGQSIVFTGIRLLVGKSLSEPFVQLSTSAERIGWTIVILIGATLAVFVSCCLTRRRL